MHADAAQPPTEPTSLWRRHRALRARLAGAPFAYGAGFALAVWGMTLFGRACMTVIALSHGYLRGLPPTQYAWLGPDIAHDVIVFALMTLAIGGTLRYAPRRSHVVVLALGYVSVALFTLIILISVPLYAALQTTLQITQLLLAGGVRDLTESAVGVGPALVALLALLLMVGLCLCVPLLGTLWLRVASPVLRARSRRVSVALGCVVLIGAGDLLPDAGSHVLQTSPVYEFAASMGRFYLRRRREPPNMQGAPHFDRSLMYAKKLPRESTSSLMDMGKLPLHRANVVLIVLESASINQTGLWNGRPQDTPRMAEMSHNGLMFDQYYTTTPVSMKSLFAMSCSAYPQTEPEAETYTNPNIDCHSISELLKAQGYRTALFHGGRFSYTRKDAFFGPRHYDVLRDAEQLHHRNRYRKVPWGADDRAVIDDAVDWLNQGDGQTPFFLHIIFLAPHEPYIVHDAPSPFGTKSAVARYRNATMFIDSQIGRLWDWVNAKGKADDTLFVIVGDHGESFGEHPGDFMHGGRIYETSVRTPLMLVNPRLFSGKRSQRIGNHLDMLPTVLDVLGLPAEPRHQGMSLLRRYQPHMIYFYADWQRHYLGLRDGEWKYIYNVDRERHELYDLTVDRGEHHNLAAGHPQQVEAYAKRALAWESFYRELVPNYEHYVDGDDACAGKASCFLDELKPVLRHGLLRKNKSGGGFPLQLGRHVFKRGLGVAPLSILRYNIRGDGFRRLTGAVGHHAQGGNVNLSLKVSTEIYLDDRLLWASGKLAADEAPKRFDLDIEDGAVLELIGHDVDGEDWRDYIDWVDVRLER